MRADMFKVIVERPRLKHPKPQKSAYPRGKMRHLYEERGFEGAPTKLSMKHRHGVKWLNENLMPLLRFLRASVGRPYRLVHAEIAAHLSVRSAVQKHVLDHLASMVAEKVVERNGELWAAWPTLGLRPLGIYRRRMLYVCPRTGLLREWFEEKEKA